MTSLPLHATVEGVLHASEVEGRVEGRVENDSVVKTVVCCSVVVWEGGVEGGAVEGEADSVEEESDGVEEFTGPSEVELSDELVVETSASVGVVEMVERDSVDGGKEGVESMDSAVVDWDHRDVEDSDAAVVD